MKKIQIVGLMLVAVFAFSAAIASSALADEFLVSAAGFNGELDSEIEGLIELRAYTNGTGTTLLNKINCEGIFDGTITGGVAPSALIEDALSLEMTLVEEELKGTGLNCTVIESKGELGDCEVNTLALVWPSNLNLSTKVQWNLPFELMTVAAEEFLLTFPATAGYDVECTTELGALSNLCEGTQGVILTNETGSSPASVLATFQGVAAAGRAACSLTGAHSGEVAGAGTLWATTGTELERLATAINP